MTPITSTQDEVPLRLAIQSQFAVHSHDNLGYLLHEIKRKQAHQLAEKILSEDKFFKLDIDKEYGSMRADVICLTQEEYANILKEKFKAGIQHAQGYMPAWGK